MKKAISLFLTAAVLVCITGGCTPAQDPTVAPTDASSAATSPSSGSDEPTVPADPMQAVSDRLEALGAYDGYFETADNDVSVELVSGTDGCWTLENGVLRFADLQEDSVYALSGKLRGNIIIDAGEDYKLELELHGFSLISDSVSPIEVISADKVSICAKSGFDNYIYDVRPEVDDEDDSAHSGAIYSKEDLELCGKGSLTVVSEHNNGIHTKDDLKVKNLSLLVACVDNALKGNDSVTVNSGTLTLIAAAGDGIKTKNSDLSSKGKQRGSITVKGGSITIIAACDGLDAAYDVVIEGEETSLVIDTAVYAGLGTDQSDSSSNNQTPDFDTNRPDMGGVPGGNMPDMGGDPPDMGTMPDFGGQPDQNTPPQMPDGQTPPQIPDGQTPPQMPSQPNGTPQEQPSQPDGTANVSTMAQGGGRPGGGGGGMGGWPGGGGMGGPGMEEGNTNKISYSAKGLKADNQVSILGGTITIRSQDDCIHANGGEALENDETSLGNVSVEGGVLNLLSDDDGIHADGTLTISGGTVTVSQSYEGLEGQTVSISGGLISVYASDDGVNGTATSGTAIEISGGTIYVCCSGDGLDSNSQTAYSGIVISGGKAVIITDSVVDSSIDTEQGYSYTGGSVIAVMSSRAMTNEPTHCRDFSSIGTSRTMNLTAGKYLRVSDDGNQIADMEIPQGMSAMVVYLGCNAATFEISDTAAGSADENGVFWCR